jgi:hypothetical protein
MCEKGVPDSCPTYVEQSSKRLGRLRRLGGLGQKEKSCFQCYSHGRNAGRFFRSSTLTDNFFTRNNVQAHILKTMFRILSAKNPQEEPKGWVGGFLAKNLHLPYLHIKMCFDRKCGGVTNDSVKSVLTELSEPKHIYGENGEYVVGMFD